MQTSPEKSSSRRTIVPEPSGDLTNCRAGVVDGHPQVTAPNSRRPSLRTAVGLRTRWVNAIFAQPFPATGVVQQLTNGQEAAPVWSGAVKEIFFRTGQTTGQPLRIFGLEVATSGGITFKNRHALPVRVAPGGRAGDRDFDVAPDGEHFIVVYPAELAVPQADARARIDVVLIWTRELQTRVPVH